MSAWRDASHEAEIDGIADAELAAWKLRQRQRRRILLAALALRSRPDRSQPVLEASMQVTRLQGKGNCEMYTVVSKFKQPGVGAVADEDRRKPVQRGVRESMIRSQSRPLPHAAEAL